MRKSEEIQSTCHNMMVTDRVSTLLICFHGKKSGNLYGEILNCYINRPVYFTGVGELMLKIDEICECLGTPMSSTAPRFFNRRTADDYTYRTKEKNKITEMAKFQPQDSISLSSHAIPAKETLIVKIEHRQNASIQGIVSGRPTSKKNVTFRSALELMRMINEISIRT